MIEHVLQGAIHRSEMPYSEVAMEMEVAGKVMSWRLEGRMVQLLRDDGTPHSFPITMSEAGIHEDDQGPYFHPV